MRKKLLYFIFFIIFCFVVNPAVYKAEYRLDCHYELDPDEHNLNTIWISFTREKRGEEWKLDKNPSGQNDAWYQFAFNKTPLSITGYLKYKIEPPSKESNICPSVLVFDTKERKVSFVDNVYYLEDFIKKDDGNFECEYEKNINGDFHRYYVPYKSTSSGIYEYTNFWQYNTITGSKGGVTGSKKRNFPVLYSFTETTNMGGTITGTICPPNAIDKGNEVELVDYKTYKLVASETPNEGYDLRCKYEAKGSSYFFYTLYMNQYGAHVYHSAGGVSGWKHKDWHYGLSSSTFFNVCPLEFKVEKSGDNEEKFSFSKQVYFYSVDNDNNSNYHCFEINDPSLCSVGSKNYSCIWVKEPEAENGGYCAIDKLQYIACGNAYDIPSFLPDIISFGVTFMKIVTPIILILVSIISLLKALAASNEDEIKKAQKGLVRKIIAAAMVFMVISIVQFVIAKVADDGETNHLDDCFNCLLNNTCKNNTYYKASIAGEPICRYLNGDSLVCPDGEEEAENDEKNNNSSQTPGGKPNDNTIDLIN